MCSASEAGSYSRLIYFVYHSTLGLRAIKKKEETSMWRSSVMMRWSDLAPWQFAFPFPGSLTSTFLGLEHIKMTFTKQWMLFKYI